MRTNGKCNNSTPHAPGLPSEPNIPEGICEENFYQLHVTQRQLLRPLSNLEKTDPSEIERPDTYNRLIV